MSSELENFGAQAVTTANQTTHQTVSLGRGTPKVIDLEVGGTTVKVRTDSTPANIKQIRELLESKFDGLAEKARGISTHQLSVLVALNLAEELIAEREKLRSLKRRVVESSDRLIERVESHLNNLNETRF